MQAYVAMPAVSRAQPPPVFAALWVMSTRRLAAAAPRTATRSARSGYIEVMGRILKRRVAALALAVGLVAGGAIAAVAATGSGGSSPGGAVHGEQFMKTAADYLGISRGRLQGELRSGQTLAQIATAEGKPVAPLMQQLGQSASSQVEGRLRASAARVGTAKRAARRRRHSLRLAAAEYLGIAPSALARQLRSGATLAQIAERTPGRSSSGLIEALVQARSQARVESGAAAGSGKAPTAAQLAKIRRHVTAQVNRSRAAKPKSGSGAATHRKKHG